jgi:hypothetical protein
VFAFKTAWLSEAPRKARHRQPAAEHLSIAQGTLVGELFVERICNVSSRLQRSIAPPLPMLYERAPDGPVFTRYRPPLSSFRPTSGGDEVGIRDGLSSNRFGRLPPRVISRQPYSFGARSSPLLNSAIPVKSLTPARCSGYPLRRTGRIGRTAPYDVAVASISIRSSGNASRVTPRRVDAGRHCPSARRRPSVSPAAMNLSTSVV